MTLASATSHAIVEKFLERIKTYRTFQPLFASNKLYAPPNSEENAPQNPNPWEIIDNLIETSTHHLLRNRADEHFFASFGKVVGESFRPRKRSHKVGFAYKEDFDVSISGGFERKNRKFLDTWKRDHPLSTEEELQEEDAFWSGAFEEQERVARVEYLKSLHREIESLVALSRGFDKEVGEQPKDDEVRPEDETHTTTEEEDLTDVEEQKRAWIMFCRGEDCSPGYTFPEKVPRIVCDYQNTEEMHEWIQHRWPHQTHRHENAALTIQRAYRVYVAKQITESRRYARWQLLRETQAAENEGIRRWTIALREDLLKQETSAAHTPESRALRFFTTKIMAVVEKKRARKRAEDSQKFEIQTYAATQIQKLFRGYRTRLCNYLHPDIQASQLQQKKNDAALRIQGTWKRLVARRNYRKMIASAISIQCCYRQHISKRRCRLLRGLKRINLEDEERMCAAHTINSFGVRNMFLKEEFYRKHKEPIDLLQRIGRGYIHRSFTYQIPWQKQKYAAGEIIAARWRDILAVRRARFYCGTFEKKRERENWHAIRTDAATTIQCAWRNFAGYRKYRNEFGKETDKEEEDDAVDTKGESCGEEDAAQSSTETKEEKEKEKEDEDAALQVDATDRAIEDTLPNADVEDYIDKRENSASDVLPSISNEMISSNDLSKGVQFPSHSSSSDTPSQ